MPCGDGPERKCVPIEYNLCRRHDRHGNAHVSKRASVCCLSLSAFSCRLVLIAQGPPV